jgi:hypothetical protein
VISQTLEEVCELNQNTTGTDIETNPLNGPHSGNYESQRRWPQPGLPDKNVKKKKNP